MGQFVEDVEPAILFEMWGGMCGVCKQYIDGEFHIDHGVPLSKGGLHGYVNCWPTHPVCNMRKHTAVEVVAL